MNNEARLSRWLTALGEQGQLEGPAAHEASVPTPNCPSLPRFLTAVLHKGWDAQELSHTRRCPYCQIMTKIVERQLGS